MRIPNASCAFSTIRPYDEEKTWKGVHAQADELDGLIEAFNEATGVLKSL